MEFSSKYEDLVRKYLQGQMNPQEKEAFEQQLKTDTELAQEYVQQKAIKKAFTAHFQQKMPEFGGKIAQIEQAIQREERWQKIRTWALVATLFLGIIGGLVWYLGSNQVEKDITHEITKIDSLQPQSGDTTIDTPPIPKPDTPSKKLLNEAPKPQNIASTNALQDSVKAYQQLALQFEKEQAEVMRLLRGNIKIKQSVVDMLDKKWQCEQERGDKSFAAPKYILPKDSLVLDSLKRYEPLSQHFKQLAEVTSQKEILALRFKKLGQLKQRAQQNILKYQQDLLRAQMLLNECKNNP